MPETVEHALMEEDAVGDDEVLDELAPGHGAHAAGSDARAMPASSGEG